MLKSISVVVAVAAALCFATTAFAAQKGPQSERGRHAEAPPAAAEEFSARPDLVAARSSTASPCRRDSDVSLKIDGTLRGSGFTGCNSWSATLYPVKDQHLAVGPYALTKKQCAKDVMQLELGFLSALVGSPTWDLVNGDLVIKGPRGALRLARSL